MTSMTPDLHDAVAARIKTGEGRYTRSRRRLVEVLLAAGQPLTVTLRVSPATDVARIRLHYRPVNQLARFKTIEKTTGQPSFDTTPPAASTFDSRKKA